MQSHPLLTVDQRSRRGQLDQDSRKQHDRRKQDQGHNGTKNVDCPFHGRIQRIIQRDTADVDDRKPLQILCIRLCRDHLVVVRNKLGVHTGLFTDRYDLLQTAVLLQA